MFYKLFDTPVFKRYVLKAAGGDERLALQRWMETLRWRCDIGDEEIFRRHLKIVF